MAKGSGVKGNYLVQTMAEAFGVEGLSIKIMGPRSKNLGTRAKAIFKALCLQRDPAAEAHVMGKMLFLKSKGAATSGDLFHLLFFVHCVPVSRCGVILTHNFGFPSFVALSQFGVVAISSRFTKQLVCQLRDARPAAAGTLCAVATVA